MRLHLPFLAIFFATTLARLSACWYPPNPTPPSSYISPDQATIRVGESTYVHAYYYAGDYDYIIDTNIDRADIGALYTEGDNDHRYHLFTPTEPGVYTFYSRITTANFYWDTYASTTVTVLSNEPAQPPTTSIYADATTIHLGESIFIHAWFAAGANDVLTASNIDLNDVGLSCGGEINDRYYAFAPTRTGTYTFYARACTAAFGWVTGNTVTVNVVNDRPIHFYEIIDANNGAIIGPGPDGRVLISPTQPFYVRSNAVDPEGRLEGHYLELTRPSGQGIAAQYPASGSDHWHDFGPYTCEGETGIIHLTVYAWDKDKEDWYGPGTPGWATTESPDINSFAGIAPRAEITVDGHTHGKRLSWIEGDPAPTITVRYKATDADGNLTGIRPQFWAHTWYYEDNSENGQTGWLPSVQFYNNNGNFIPQAGGSGEYVQTFTLNSWYPSPECHYYFWTDAQDALGNSVNSGSDGQGGAWQQGFHLIVDQVQNAAPNSVTLNNTSTALTLGDSVAVSSTASDLEQNLAYHSFWSRGPRSSDTFAGDGDGWISYADDATNWSNYINPGTPSDPASSSISATFTPPAPGYWQIHANVYDTRGAWGPGATSQAIYVNNVEPTNQLTFTGVRTDATTGALYVYADDAFSLTHTAGNPFPDSSFAHYETGFKLRKRFLLPNNTPAGDWETLNAAGPATGTRSYVQSYPGPHAIGTIEFHITAWNQWVPSETGALRQYIIQVRNRPPTVTLTSSASSLYYGQSTTLTATANDADGNLSASAIRRAESGDFRRPSGIDYSSIGWNGYSTETGWSSSSFASDAIAGGSSNIKTINYKPVGVGAFTFSAQVKDNAGATSPVALANLTVGKATPTASASNQTGGEGTALTAAQLSVVFRNPNDGNLSVPGTVSYEIVANGVAPYFGNGTFLYPGQFLPASNYVVRAKVNASANYNEGTVDFNLFILAEPNADSDGDGVVNWIERTLGTDPFRAPDGNSAAVLQLKIHTPRP